MLAGLIAPQAATASGENEFATTTLRLVLLITALDLMMLNWGLVEPGSNWRERGGLNSSGLLSLGFSKQYSVGYEAFYARWASNGSEIVAMTRCC